MTISFILCTLIALFTSQILTTFIPIIISFVLSPLGLSQIYSYKFILRRSIGYMAHFINPLSPECWRNGGTLQLEVTKPQNNTIPQHNRQRGGMPAVTHILLTTFTFFLRYCFRSSVQQYNSFPGNTKNILAKSSSGYVKISKISPPDYRTHRASWRRFWEGLALPR